MISKKNLSILLLAAMSLSSTFVQAPKGSWCCGRRGVLASVVTSATTAALTPGGDPLHAAATAALAETEAAAVTTALNPGMDLEGVSEVLASNIRSLLAIGAGDAKTMGLDTVAFNLQSQMEGAAVYFGLDARTLQSMTEEAATNRGAEKEDAVTAVLNGVARRLTASVSDSLPLLESSLRSAMQSPTAAPIVRTFLSFLRDLVKVDAHDDSRSTVSQKSRFTIAAMETNVSRILDAVDVAVNVSGGSSAASSTRTGK